MTNFLVVMTDDQRFDTLATMPFTRNLGGKGRLFTGCRVDVSVCQAQRSSFLSGQYAKRHLCYQNALADLAGVTQNNLLAAWLDTASYRTGLIGKYLNAVVAEEAKPTGWDIWRKVKDDGGGSNAQFDVWDNAATTTKTQYQNEWIVSEATTFIAGSEPWFLLVAPEAPHYPFSPRPIDCVSHLDYAPALVEETDVSDKPAWVQAKPALTYADKLFLRAVMRGEQRELESVDTMMRSLMALVDLTDTVVFFVADNGINRGEHRIQQASLGKSDPYDTSLRVPLVVAGEGFTLGTTAQPVHLQDITKTILAMSGATAVGPHATQDGIDLRSIQNTPGDYTARELLHQVRGALLVGCPDLDSITTMTRKLVRYYGDVDTFARPDSDTVTSNVTFVGGPTAAWDCVNESSPNDADYVEGVINTAATFTMHTTNVTDPNYAQSTTHILRYRVSRGTVSVSAVDVTAELLQGASTVLASVTTTVNYSTPTTLTLTLTPAQADAITDYTDLRMRFTQTVAATGHMRVYWAELEVPTRTYEAYDLDTDPKEWLNWAAEGGRITERNNLETALNNLL
jgi:arylsulfatase A-like enzyme